MNHNGNGIVDGKQKKNGKLWVAKEENGSNYNKNQIHPKISVWLKENIFIYHKKMIHFSSLPQLFFLPFFILLVANLFIFLGRERRWKSLFIPQPLPQPCPCCSTLSIARSSGNTKNWESDLYKNYISR